MKKLIIIACLLFALCLAMSGCRRRSSGLYTEEEMTQIHDITQVVQGRAVAYDRVIMGSIPATLSMRLSSDPSFSDYISTSTLDPEKPMIALTFDDGPKADTTSRVLDALEQNGAKATFFVVGYNLSDDTAHLLKRMADLGCEIGSHTCEHTNLTTVDATFIQNDEIAMKENIEYYSGKTCTIMRPPGGAVNDDVLRDVGLPVIQWYVDTKDWATRDTDSIVSIVENYAFDGAIVLMHDIYDSTALAAEILIPELVSRGYQLVTVSQLAQMKGISLEPGTEYFSLVDEEMAAAMEAGMGPASPEDDGNSYDNYFEESN